MKYSKILQLRPSNYEEKQINLQYNPSKLNKKTLLFDLDETLIHCNDSLQQPNDFKLNFTTPLGENHIFGVNIRPNAIACLEELTKHFEIIIFTASHTSYASKIIENLDPEKKIIDHILYRDQCITTAEGLHVKDLRVIGNRKIENLCLIDNATYSFALQINNGIPILPFYNNKRDNELILLIPYIMQFLDGDIQTINKRTFQFEKYLDVERPNDVLNQFI